MKAAEYIAVLPGADLNSLTLCDGEAVFSCSQLGCGGEWNAVVDAVFSPEVKKAGHGVKDFMSLALGANVEPAGFVFDTELAAYVLDPTESAYPLDRLSLRHLGGELPPAEAVWRLYPVLDAKLTESGAHELYYGIELPLCRVLADMERAGFLVDREALAAYGESMVAGINALQERIWAQAGHEFNINSPKQLGEVLFDELMLPAGKKTKTGWSTNADVLEKLRGKHPIISDILDYRMLTKLKSTYADGLLKNEEVYNIFDTAKLLNRPPKVMISNTSGVSGIAIWINQHLGLSGEEALDKKDPLVVGLKQWVDRQYDEGRVVAITDAELEVQLASLMQQMKGSGQGVRQDN